MGNLNKNESSDNLKKVGNKNLNNIKKLDDNSLDMSAGRVTGMGFNNAGVYAYLQCEHCGESYRVDGRDYGTPNELPMEALKCKYCGEMISDKGLPF